MKYSMKYRIFALALAMMLVNAYIVVPIAKAQTPVQNTFTDIPVRGTVDGIAFTNGTLDIQQFLFKKNGLIAVGTLTVPGTTILNQAVQLPVTITNSTCDILELTLGPLDLDLLGLVVHLDQVHLEITAEAGPGNLLGNLLCAVTGLLDNGLDELLGDLLTLIVDIFEELGL